MNWQTAIASLGGTLMVAALALLGAVFLWSVVEMTRVVLAHRQRMALIARGMHPDLRTEGGMPAGSAPAEAVE